MWKSFTLGTSLKASVTLQSNSLIEYKEVLWKGIFLTLRSFHQKSQQTITFCYFACKDLTGKIIIHPKCFSFRLAWIPQLILHHQWCQLKEYRNKEMPNRESPREEVANFGFSLCKLWGIDPSVAKQPLKICKDAKFECYLLKTNEDIVLLYGRGVGINLCPPPHHINFCSFLQLWRNICSHF